MLTFPRTRTHTKRNPPTRFDVISKLSFYIDPSVSN